MGLRDNVFASKAERRNYYKLRRSWEKDYFIYPNLPFLAVFKPSPLIDSRTLQPLTLTDLELARLKKTSIDYTLCDRDDRPLVCIEFDGLQEGVNVGTRYHTAKPAGDQWRDEILSLKLKVAHGSLFPFFIVSSSEFKDIEQDVQLTILDGIIGEVVSSRRTHERFAQGFSPTFVGLTQEQFDDLLPHDQHELVQDWVWGVEVEEDLEHNPVVRLSAEMAMELGAHRWSFTYTTYPELPSDAGPVERGRLLRDAVLYSGVKMTLHTDDCGDIVTSVMLPNFQTPAFSGLGLTEDIAKIIGMRRYKRLLVQMSRHLNAKKE
jgi:hypothetical protein